MIRITQKMPQNEERREGPPKLYREASKVLKKVNEGAGLKDIIYQINHPNIRGVYALVCKAVQNNELLENIIEKTGMLNEKFDPNLAKILVTELLWGKKEIPGNSKPVQETLKFAEALKEAVENVSIPVVLTEVRSPRYVRINTLLVTINGTIERLTNDGWNLVDTPETYESFVECADNLNDEEFMRDYHFEDVLVFPPKSNLHEHKLAQNGSLLMQDKASCLPALLLDPKPGSVVLDMCAAPGMKTSHLANIMQNKGTLYAVDRDRKRFENMTNMVKRNCRIHNCVQMKLADSIHLTSEDCPGVQYILVDPSCSGSGMVSRIESREKAKDTSSKRLDSLTNFQERLLVQALTAFPDVDRVVYSTCSLLEEENERVLEHVLKRVPSFEVVPPQLKKPWERRGNPKYSFGPDCLVADMDKDRTNGFFVAVLERVPGMEPSVETKFMKRKSNVSCNQTTDADSGWEVPKKRKKPQKNLKKGKGKKVEMEDNSESTWEIKDSCKS